VPPTVPLPETFINAVVLLPLVITDPLLPEIILVLPLKVGDVVNFLHTAVLYVAPLTSSIVLAVQELIND
jgi:hypothetical protein